MALGTSTTDQASTDEAPTALWWRCEVCGDPLTGPQTVLQIKRAGAVVREVLGCSPCARIFARLLPEVVDDGGR